MIMPESTRIETNTILPPRLENNDDGNDDLGCCYCRFDVTASFCALLIPRYTVTMLQLLTVQTIQTIQTNIPVKNNFRRYKKERKNKNEMISHIQSAIQRQRAQ